VFVGKGRSAQPVQAKAGSGQWSRLLSEKRGRRGNVGKGRENSVVVLGNMGAVAALGHVRKILRAREKGADDRLRLSVLCSRSF